MKKLLLAVLAVCLITAVSLAADWDIARVTQQGEQLIIHVTKAPDKAHNFKITNVRDETIGNLYGYKDDMLVFEGSWDDLVRQRFAGLYLDGDGQRHPLFKPVSGAIWEGGYSQYIYPSSRSTTEKQYILHEPHSVEWNRYIKPNDVVVLPKRLIHTYSEHANTTIIPRGKDGGGVILRDGTQTVIQKDKHTIVLRNGTPVTVRRPDGTKVSGPGINLIIDGSIKPGPDASVGVGECECDDGDGKAMAGGEGIGPAPGPGDALAQNKPASGESPQSPKSPNDPAANGAAPGPGSPGGPGPGQPGQGSGGPEPQGKTGNAQGQSPTGPATIGAQPSGNKEKAPSFVLYVACGGWLGDKGKVYQVNEHGRILGWIDVPSAPTGIALHRDNGLVVALPRDGGKIIRINETGKQNVLLEKQATLVHPVDVGISGGSDSILVADNIGDVLVATTVGGTKPKIFKRFEDQKWTAQNMSVAITNGKATVFGDDAGILYNSTRVFPTVGGVAADPASFKWAATQPPNQVYVLEGQSLQRKLRLPPGKSHYNQGMLSFGPVGSLAVTARDSDKADAQPWFLLYGAEGTDDIRALFQWEKEVVNDFVIGPRMLWDNVKVDTKTKEIY